MPREIKKVHSEDLRIVLGGPSHYVVQTLGLAKPDPLRQLTKVALLLLVTWVPLVVLSILAGHALEGVVKVPFFSDVEVQARFLFVLPLLKLPVIGIAAGLATASWHFLERGVVPEREQARFTAARDGAIRARNSPLVEGVLVVLSYVASIALRLALNFDVGDSSWERDGSTITLAGWWYMLVSLPVLYFYLLRWVWIFILWAWYLFRISRLKLELTATHPDRSGGLAFVGWGLVAFAVPLMALSGIVSAALGDLILNHDESLNSLKFHVATFVITAVVVIHLPLVAFSGQIMRCRVQGLLDIGALAWRHDRAFDEKWLEHPTSEDEQKLLGTPDVQSLADMGTCYEHADRMWPLPLDLKASSILVIAALLPMTPLVGTAIPLKEIFLKLGELLI